MKINKAERYIESLKEIKRIKEVIKHLQTLKALVIKNYDVRDILIEGLERKILFYEQQY